MQCILQESTSALRHHNISQASENQALQIRMHSECEWLLCRLIITDKKRTLVLKMAVQFLYVHSLCIQCLSFYCQLSHSLPRLFALTLAPSRSLPCLFAHICAHSCSLPQMLMHEYLRLEHNTNNADCYSSAPYVVYKLVKHRLTFQALSLETLLIWGKHYSWQR